ncbi:MAG TPA: NAD-dependent epimerase/dehydratase family protein [Flavobacteriaceae bacterium]|nr:NAD-dependent epimerase/dehydratase family protein [Flavobacteriaceae bacterium]
MILVTGATGLVGSHLLYFLMKKNAKVKAIYRTKNKLQQVKNVFSYYGENNQTLFDKIEWIEADITDVFSLTNAFKNVTQVYHAAALISLNSKDYVEMRKINIEGTANVVNLCIENKIEKLCYVSSIASLGKSSSKKIIDENSEWDTEQNNSTYAITKYGAELEVWRGSQEGVPVVIVNPGVILGSGFWNSGTGKIFDKMYNGLSYYSKGITGFIGVEDVAKVMVKLMESNIINERYILVAENLSYKTVFFEIANCFNVKKPSILVKPWMSAVFWRFETIKSWLFSTTPLITESSAKSMHNKRNYSSEKIKNQLNYNFTKIDKVIAKVCKHYLQDN